jgi:DNA modification methylase
VADRGDEERSWRLERWDVTETPWPIADESVQCCVTSPPYWGLRDYGVAGQLGLERTPAEYVEKMVAVFREVRRVLRKDGTVWLNLGDCYNAYNGGAGPGSKLSGNQTKARPRLQSGYGIRDSGLKPKDLVGIPWRVAFALQADGWWLRSDIVWAKPNPMPESITDRPTRAHEYVFLLTKSARYFYDADAIRTAIQQPAAISRRHAGFNGRWDALSKEQQAAGANARTVWSIATEPYAEAHFATFPTELARRCILAGSREGDTVLDPFMGSGTVALVCDMLGRRSVGLELNPEYVALAERRITAPRTAEGLEKAAMEEQGQVVIQW